MERVCITGIGRGLGAAIAEKFLAKGWAVVGTTRDGKARLSHEQLTVYPLELTDNASIETFAQLLERSDTRMNVLVNNAGVFLDRDEGGVNQQKLRDTLEVNLLGTIAFTERILGRVNGGGHILNISSQMGSLANTDYPGAPAYKISKAALNMYTRSLAARLKNEGTLVSAVHPGWVKTDMGGIGAQLEPEDAAQRIFEVATEIKETGGFWFGKERMSW